MTRGQAVPSVEPVSGTALRNEEVVRADRLASSGLFQCITIVVVLIGALLVVP